MNANHLDLQNGKYQEPLDVSARLQLWKEEATNPDHPNYYHAELDRPAAHYVQILTLVEKLRDESKDFGRDDVVELFGLLNSGQRTKDRLADNNSLPDLRLALIELLDGEGSPASRIDVAASRIVYAGPAMLGELYGWVHAEEAPLFNRCAIDALEHLGYDVSMADYDGFVAAHDQFKVVYRKTVGRLRNDIPLNLEIDKFYNVLDKVDLVPVENGEDRRYWRITQHDRWTYQKPDGETQAMRLWEGCLKHGVAALDFDGHKHRIVQRFMTIQEGDGVIAFLGDKKIGAMGVVTSGYDDALFQERPAELDYWSGKY